MFESLVKSYFEGEPRRPHWLNATLLGGGMVLAMTVLRNGGVAGIAAVMVVLAFKFGPITLLWMPGLLLLAIIAGMVGGLAYGILRPIRRGTFLGNWLSWTVGITAYLVTILGVLEVLGLSGRMSLRDPVVWYIILGMAAVYAGIASWNSEPDDYVSGPYVPLSAEQRQVARRAASRRLWEGTESRLRQREQQFRAYGTRPEEPGEAARLLHDQLADLERTEHALRRSISAQGYGEKELAALIGWRERLRARSDARL